MNTDRPLQQEYIRNTRHKSLLKISLAGLFIFGSIFWFISWISPSISRTQIRTAKVERGNLEATITASGTVVPEYEQVISSPIDTRILRILKKAGDTLHPNDPILVLDLETAKLAYEKMKDQLALKINAQYQAKASLENQLIKLNSQIKIKQLEMNAKKEEVVTNKPFYEQRYVTKDEYDKMVLDYETAQTQLQELIETKKNVIESTRLQQEGIDLEIKTYKTEEALLKQELEMATTKAIREGVLTWVTLSEGATIRKGDVIAKVADLNSYRVDATISDVHASRLTIGMPVQVKLDETLFKGIISNILPTVENGVVRAQITLEDKSNRLLRPSMRVDVYAITDSKSNVLKVKKGLVINTDGKSEVFVIRDGQAIRTPVTIGISSFDYQEIVNGLAEGDEIIISDMDNYAHLKEINIK
ncbi:HlyD family efflux transporter periplasmic adaptor subunit [Rhodocytophaga aerolata]|uniref:HlyD family efflux transporter periplasmic adaptor subunit n=1 Tax=Rhodocytophaga aerolata TaxID=455078 RepID=A0ABT8R5S0_9BACT|nr:HlyD family efflux transporter periplasmic adaptor subunit [Rhodocytophaga aerolata]MDO1446112.1 HlyD family efflux transporter periplasmic adaptor subunit [Rhodocytophaga aerolata]